MAWISEGKGTLVGKYRVYIHATIFRQHFYVLRTMPWTMNMVKTKAGKGPAFMGTVFMGGLKSTLYNS